MIVKERECKSYDLIPEEITENCKNINSNTILDVDINDSPSNLNPTDQKNINVQKDNENVVKIGEFLILEKDGPDNESDIEEEDYDKDSYHNQVAGNSSNNLANNANSNQILKRNELQKVNTIIQNVELYKTNSNKNVQRKCVCCDRSDLFPSEMLKFKTIEDFIIYFKFLYEKRVSVLKTDEENFEDNRQVLYELSNTLQKIQKFNLKSVRYLCKTCLVTKLNQAEGMNFIYRALEIHMVLESFLNTNSLNQPVAANVNSSGANNSYMNLPNPSKPTFDVNNLNSINSKKKNLFETKMNLENTTSIDHQLIENLKQGLSGNTHSGNLMNTSKIGNYVNHSGNLNEMKNTMNNTNFNHSQILNKVANAKDEESANINHLQNLQNNFENYLINNSGTNNNTGNLNLSNNNLNINMNNTLGMNRGGLDMSNLLNLSRGNQQNTQTMSNPMSNPQMILQKIAEVQGNINNMNPMGITNQNNQQLNMNLGQNFNQNNNNINNINNFSNNFTQVVDAINSFNSKNINHNSNLVNSVSQLAGVLSNYLNNEDGENVTTNNQQLMNGDNMPEMNLEKDGEGENKKENLGEKEQGANEDEKKDDVNVTNIIMNFDKAPILSYMMNVLEDLKKQIVAIQYYSLLQKLFISYIFKNLEALMEQISNNQLVGNNQTNPSMNEFNQNPAFMNFLQKSSAGQHTPKGMEGLFNLMTQNINPNNSNSNQSQVNMMNVSNLPDFLKKAGKIKKFNSNYY